MTQYLTTGKVCKLAGITTRQLNHWVDQKYILPENYYYKTQGEAFTWASREVEKVMLMARIIGSSILPHVAAWIADYAMAHPGDPVVLGKGLFLLIEDNK